MFKLLYLIADRVFLGLIFVIDSWERTFASLLQNINEVPVYEIALSGSAVVSGLHLISSNCCYTSGEVFPGSKYKNDKPLKNVKQN